MKEVTRRERNAAFDPLNAKLIDQLIKEAGKFLHEDPVRAIRMAEEANDLSVKLEYQTGQAHAIRITGLAYSLEKDRSDESLELLMKALAIFRNTNHHEGQCQVMMNIGNVHYYNGNTSKAITCFMKSLEISQKTDNNRLTGSVYNNLSIAYQKQNDLSRALKYAFESLNLKKSLQDPATYSEALSHIGNIYSGMKNFDLALRFHEQSLEVQKENNITSNLYHTYGNIGNAFLAMRAFKKALEHFEDGLESARDSGNKAAEGTILNYIGRIFYEEGAWDGALKYHFIALDIFRQEKDHEKLADTHFRIGLCHTNMGELKLAEAALLECSGLAVQYDLPIRKKEAGEALAEVYRRKGSYSRGDDSEAGDDVEDASGKRHLVYKYELEQNLKEKEIYELKNRELGEAIHRLDDLIKKLITANNEKTELLGIVAHDLKNPLSGIMGILDLLRDNFSDYSKEETSHFLQLMDSSANHMFELVTDLLSISVIEEGRLNLKMEPVGLNNLIDKLIYNYQRSAKKKNIEIISDRKKDAGFLVYADRKCTNQVLNNLISNALKFSPPNKNIWINLEEVAGIIRCTVRDEGPGISKDDQQKLFQKFERLSAQPTAGESSTGLGLSIVKKLVEQMKGKIWCESDAGKGTSFIFELQKAE